jgi:hypothetical protein
MVTVAAAIWTTLFDLDPKDSKASMKGEKAMKLNTRVLSRSGARELTVEEAQLVAGSTQFHTLVCTAIVAVATTTGPGDGDGCSDMDR